MGTFNVILSWTTGSDLDINVMCGCGNWHGKGTNDVNCSCNICGMKLDKETKDSDDDNRKEDETIEHVYFSNPD